MAKTRKRNTPKTSRRKPVELSDEALAQAGGAGEQTYLAVKLENVQVTSIAEAPARLSIKDGTSNTH